MAIDDHGDDGPSSKLHLPRNIVVPEIAVLEEDIRAALQHSVNLREALEETKIVCSPIWEGHAGEAAVRAAVVPAQVVTRHNDGAGMRALSDPSVVTMLADIIAILIEEPEGAVKVLEPTERLWMSEDAPVRSLEMPYKPHYRVLTLVIADFTRKIGAGFTEDEWIASLGLLDAFHDPETDPPREAILGSTRAKVAAMCAEEAEWMRALQAEV